MSETLKVPFNLEFIISFPGTKERRSSSTQMFGESKKILFSINPASQQIHYQSKNDTIESFRELLWKKLSDLRKDGYADEIDMDEHRINFIGSWESTIIPEQKLILDKITQAKSIRDIEQALAHIDVASSPRSSRPRNGF